MTKTGQFSHAPSNSRLIPASIEQNQPANKPAVFLDRDGVMVEDVEYLRKPSQLRLLPGVPEALRLLQSRLYILVATNQSGIARGFFSEDELALIHDELISRITGEGAVVDGICFCPHLPGAPIPEYDTVCDCRKPKPGMFYRARDHWSIDLSASFMVGDQPSDVEAAHAAGVKGLLIGNNAQAPPGTWATARDLLEAAQIILKALPGLEIQPV